MNSQPSVLSLEFSPRRPARAHFSPLLRHATLTAAGHGRPLRGLTSQVSEEDRPPEQLSLAAAAPAPRWWDPHLVDRLQTSLTRHRD